MKHSLRQVENLHIAFWLLKDLGWVQEIHVLGLFMVVPTLAVAIWLTWQLRHELAELAHNLAVCCWIVANAIWMVGEFFYHDSTRGYATIFFAVGIATLGVYYAGRIRAHLRAPQPPQNQPSAEADPAQTPPNSTPPIPAEG
jgi:thiol:disulfide interchange protein